MAIPGESTDPVDEGLTDEQRKELLEGGYSEGEVDWMEAEAEREANIGSNLHRRTPDSC